MATISFSNARDMTERSEAWMKSVSDFIKDPVNSPVPTDIYDTQKLAFEVDIQELKDLIDKSEKLVGVLGYETGANTLSFILVGTDKNHIPAALVAPVETWPMLKEMKDLNKVLTDYLTP